jgi:hypothetical protein
MGKLRGVGLLILAGVTLWLGWTTGAPPRVHACDVIPTDAFRTELGWRAPVGTPEQPERQGLDDTVCAFGNATRGAQVFEVHDGSSSFYERQLRGGGKDVIDGAGYRAFLWRDSLFLYSEGEYVNVRLTGFPPGSVTKLIPSIVEGVKQ